MATVCNPTRAAALELNFGLEFRDLYEQSGLAKLDSRFLDYLRTIDKALLDRLLSGRTTAREMTPKQRSELILDLVEHLENFIGHLFGIEDELRELGDKHRATETLLAVKRQFVQRSQYVKLPASQVLELDGAVLGEALELDLGEPLSEESYAEHVARWLEEEAANREKLALAGRYAAWALGTSEGHRKHARGVLFRFPQKIDMFRLVPVQTLVENGVEKKCLGPEDWRYRNGFQLTDEGMSLVEALDQTHYCIKCHNQGKDSCSTGLREKTGEFKTTVFGVTLNGCPLEEKISEFHIAKEQGLSAGALAIITVDNPMAAATGHRICNDCMKSCIYQKQEPVNIPQVETRTLKDVLALPWGFEIYSLLTRWNPLNFEQPVPLAPSGYKVLVAGLGPAGFTLAHYLLNQGHTVVGVDGLKIEPLEPEISGVDSKGSRTAFRPIRDVTELYEPLESRSMAGFGGVAEYGITVRWDKNFLKIIRLLIERRERFAMYGGVRFGGTLTPEGAYQAGFDHIALCMGAGRPTVIEMKNGLARGVRQASDFLMALQLTGAAQRESLANLQIRMPVVVIGGGLTAIDTATESLAYYIVQVEKFLARYEILCAERGEQAVRSGWNAEESAIADEFLSHARAICVERQRAEAEGRPPRFIELLNSWGGVTIAYRRRLVDSPSYILNHEEVQKSMEEGVRFAEGLSPEEVLLDAFGHARGVRFSKSRYDSTTGKMAETGESVELPAGSILVAAGTQPNTVLAREQPGIVLDGKHFQAVDADGRPVTPERLAKPKTPHVLMSIGHDGRAMSFFGDLHPSFSGNVVKALASARLGYPVIGSVLERRRPEGPSPEELLARMNEELRPVVHQVERLTPTIVEVVVKAPQAARMFNPGQFYRLQNYEANALRSNGTTLSMEGLALTGASVDRERGLVSLIALEMGGSSDLCTYLRPGEPVVLMGPTGAPTETPSGETVLLVGGGLGNAVLFSIGQALRAHGSRVVYFAGYKKVIDRYKVEEIERAADVVVWCCDESPGFEPDRPQDRATVANIVESMVRYARGDLGKPEILLSDVDRIIAIGSDGMMAAVARSRTGVLAPYLRPGHCAIGSINSPMQCMMKEVCAQCLQKHRDPVSGREFVVFSCFNQDQPLDRVDFRSLRDRLSQNTLQEKLTRLWIDRSLRQLALRA
jgi:NADPH-dependent glutamate synthase beta subunit-like oxidoreductase/NAD(P)H-flavin reductase